MKFYQGITLCALIALFPNLSFAQPMDVIVTTTITGKVVDANTNEPLSFATASLLSPADSSLITGTTTDFDGNFELKTDAVDFVLQITFVSYKKQTIRDFNRDGNLISLGTINMLENSMVLDEIEVVAEKSQMSLSLDKRVFNVGKDLSNTGMNASELLDNIPSVQVDVEGNVSLRGSQGVRILLDGKPSGLVGLNSTEGLRQLQGDMIERVEIITNPSARYEAEGEVGIINIILKKGKKDGFNGSFAVRTGFPGNHGLSYTLNYRKDNFNWFTSLGAGYRESPGFTRYYQRSINQDGSTSAFRSNNDRRRTGFSGNFQFGTNWFINDYNMLTGSFVYGREKNENFSDLLYEDLDENDDVISRTLRETIEEEPETDVEANLNYEKTFERHKDQKWTVDLKLFTDTESELSDYQEFVDNNTPILQQSDNVEKNSNFLFQTDYIHPLGEGAKFEAGLRASVRTIDNDFFVEELDPVTDQFVRFEDLSNQLQFEENIYAAYAIYAKEFERFSAQFGLRAEQSDITVSLIETNESNNQNYFSFFPSANLAYKLNDEDQIQLSYSRRINRPRFRSLLPFSSFSDPRNNFAGNPNLQPEFTNSFETSYLKYWDSGSVLTSLYYRHRQGVVERIITINPDGTTLRIPVNLSTQNAYGIEFNANQDITKAWSINANFNFYRAITDGEFEGVRFYNDAITWNTRFNTNIEFFELIDFQGSIFYTAPENTAQGRRRSLARVDLGASTDLLKGRATLAVNVRDLFNSRRFRSIVEQADFFSERDSQWRPRTLTINLSYRINQKKRDRRGGRGDGGMGGDEY
ncbi:MAG: TonB-dependent receptor [Bacteroidota bacterium]